MWKLLLAAGTFLSKAADSLALSLSTVQSEEADGRLEVGVRRVRPFSAFRESKLSSSSQDMLDECSQASLHFQPPVRANTQAPASHTIDHTIGCIEADASIAFTWLLLGRKDPSAQAKDLESAAGWRGAKAGQISRHGLMV